MSESADDADLFYNCIRWLVCMKEILPITYE